ncbi:MAG: tetratricopeptide repeat protein [Verrucomicrobiales bacterium]|nr:tetratricopeptide repeat protein [Verrucomicrobiales bacterium]
MPDEREESESGEPAQTGAENTLTEQYQKALADKIIEVEALLVEASPASLPLLADKIATLETDLAAIRQLTPPPPRLRDLEVAVFTVKGHVERNFGKFEASEATYGEAIRILQAAGNDDESVSQRIANLWTCCGLSALSENSKEARERSIGHFDKAISIRENTPEPTLSDQWGLSASWLNRGDALSRLGGEENLNLSLEATGKAAEILESFNLDENPAFRTRMALAWMNRGAAYIDLTSEYGRPHQDDAIDAYQTAIEKLRPGAEKGIPETERILAVALTNLSRARLQLGGHFPEAGVAEAREALTLVGENEIADLELANLGITARISLCRSLELLQGNTPGDLEVTDIAEEGLSIVMKVRKNIGRFFPGEAMLGELMRCGAEAYLKHSPHFLADYLMEFLSDENENHLADVGACHEVAVQVLWQGISELQEKGFQDIGTEAFEKREALLISWHQCREALAEIRARYFEI